MAVIVIDPGHGGFGTVGGSSSNNATGPNGTLEKTLTLDISQRLGTILGDAGHFVWLTREGDTNLSLAARAGAAAERKADVFVSIHFNASKDHSAQGTETWIDANHSEGCAKLASCIQGEVQAIVQSRDRGVRISDELGVLRRSRHLATTAAVLNEVSFLDREEEEDRLESERYRQAIAQALADGVQLYLQPPETAVVPTYIPQFPLLNRVKSLFRSPQDRDG